MSSVDTSADDDQLINQSAETCRICRSEGTEQEPLFHPCKCSGSIKYVHEECLMEWLKRSNNSSVCELCKTPFTFKKVYSPGMPSSIPFTTLIARIFVLLIGALKRLLINVKELQKHKLYFLYGICVFVLPIILREKHYIVVTYFDNLFVREKAPLSLRHSQPIGRYVPNFVLNILKSSWFGFKSHDKIYYYQVCWIEGAALLIMYAFVLLVFGLTKEWTVPNALDAENAQEPAFEVQPVFARRVENIMEDENVEQERVIRLARPVRGDGDVFDPLLEGLNELNFDPEEIEAIRNRFQEVLPQIRNERMENNGQGDLYDLTVYTFIWMAFLVLPENMFVIPLSIARIHLLVFGTLAAYIFHIAVYAGNALADMSLLAIDKVTGLSLTPLNEISEIFKEPIEFVYTQKVIDFVRTPQPISVSSGIAFAFVGVSIMSVYLNRYINSSFRFASSPEYQRIEKSVIQLMVMTGNVLKVILITFLELVAFPIFCGFLIKVSLIPIFSEKDAFGTLMTLWNEPFSYSWLFWFAGTLYMYQFAKFVSMCRIIMRSGVLYFIRNPQDPNFHPVDEILVRPIMSQLEKLLLSAVMYTVAIVVCIGGVIWSLRFGLDVPFLPLKDFSFGLGFPKSHCPLFLAELTDFKLEKLNFDIWVEVFKHSCRKLRLSSFILDKPNSRERTVIHYGSFKAWLTGVKPASPVPVSSEEASKIDENQAVYVQDGTFVRAPSSDNVSQAKRLNSFIEVTKEDVRIDGKEDGPDDIKDYLVLFRPNRFWLRIYGLLFIIWFVGAVLIFTITGLPLIIGRYILFLLGAKSVSNNFRTFSFGSIPTLAVLISIAQREELQKFILKCKNAIKDSVSNGSSKVLFYKLGKLALFLLSYYLLIPTLVSYTLFQLEYSFELPEEHCSFFSSRVLENNIINMITSQIVILYVFIRQPAAIRPVSNMANLIIANGYMDIDIKSAIQLAAVPVSIMIVYHILPFIILFSTSLSLSWKIESPLIRFANENLYLAGFLTLSFGAVIYLIHRIWISWQMKVRDDLYLMNQQLQNLER